MCSSDLPSAGAELLANGRFSELLQEALGRFERVAQVAFAVTALTGVLRATEQLQDVNDLWTTAYGEVLAVKIVGVLAMLAVSLAWRRGSPLARADAAIAVAVVGLTALLAAFPLPVN